MATVQHLFTDYLARKHRVGIFQKITGYWKLVLASRMRIIDFLLACESLNRAIHAFFKAAMTARMKSLAFFVAGKLIMPVRKIFSGLISMTEGLTGMAAISPGFANLVAAAIWTFLEVTFFLQNNDLRVARTLEFNFLTNASACT